MKEVLSFLELHINISSLFILKTGSLNNAIQEFMSHYTILYKFGNRARNFWGCFYLILVFFPLALVGYELAIYLVISNARSRTNFFLNIRVSAQLAAAGLLSKGLLHLRMFRCSSDHLNFPDLLYNDWIHAPTNSKEIKLIKTDFRFRVRKLPFCPHKIDIATFSGKSSE